jgi:hypothetical protein
MGTGYANLVEILALNPNLPICFANVTSWLTASGFSGGGFVTTIALLIHYIYPTITYFISVTITP